MIKFSVKDLFGQDIPNCEFSIYKGILIVWDEDTDTRIINFIDNLPQEVLDKLLVIGEHEGAVSFLWKHIIPVGYSYGNSYDIVDGDVWGVNESKILNNNIQF